MEIAVRRRPNTIAALLLCCAVAITLTSRADAAPCNTASEQTEISGLLRAAGEDRPINVTFATTASGVKMPAFLLKQYPQEITIILQFEFDRLAIQGDHFSVGLWFKGKYARLTVPFGAIRFVWDRTELMCGGTEQRAEAKL